MTPNEAARKYADANPEKLFSYAIGAGWPWLEEHLHRIAWHSLPSSPGPGFTAGIPAGTPECQALNLLELVYTYKRQATPNLPWRSRTLIAILAALPETPKSRTGRSLLTALVEWTPPSPAKWDTRRHKNLPALLVNTRHIMPTTNRDRQQHLPFDLDTSQSAPPSNDEPRFEQPALIPDWGVPPSKLIPVLLLDMWDSGPSRGQSGPVPVPQRAAWELLLAPAPGDYVRGVADVQITVGELAQLVWPATGRYKRTEHGYQLREAARWLNDPDNATRWSAHALDTPTNLVLWYNAPVEPYYADQKIGAYITVPDGGRRRGAQIDNYLRRILAATSYRQHRVYVTACVLWDRYATVRGYLVQLTIPEVNRSAAGYVLGPGGEIATEKDGSPSRRPTHQLAVHTGKRLPNATANNTYPWLEGEDAILVAHHRLAGTVKLRNMQRGFTIETLQQLADVEGERRRAGKPGAVLDFETRYRGEGRLSASDLTKMKLPPASELEAVRLLPPTAHFASHKARREKAATIKKAQRRRRRRRQ